MRGARSTLFFMWMSSLGKATAYTGMGKGWSLLRSSDFAHGLLQMRCFLLAVAG